VETGKKQRMLAQKTNSSEVDRQTMMETILEWFREQGSRKRWRLKGCKATAFILYLCPIPPFHFRPRVRFYAKEISILLKPSYDDRIPDSQLGCDEVF